MTNLDSIFREDDGTPLQYSCLENPMNRGAWWAAVHGVAKSQTQLSDFPFTFHFHALKKEMATHSITLAWKIPWTKKPGRLHGITKSQTRLSNFSFTFTVSPSTCPEVKGPDATILVF